MNETRMGRPQNDEEIEAQREFFEETCLSRIPPGTTVVVVVMLGVLFTVLATVSSVVWWMRVNPLQ